MNVLRKQSVNSNGAKNKQFRNRSNLFSVKSSVSPLRFLGQMDGNSRPHPTASQSSQGSDLRSSQCSSIVLSHHSSAEQFSQSSGDGDNVNGGIEFVELMRPFIQCREEEYSDEIVEQRPDIKVEHENQSSQNESSIFKRPREIQIDDSLKSVSHKRKPSSDVLRIISSPYSNVSNSFKHHYADNLQAPREQEENNISNPNFTTTMETTEKSIGLSKNLFSTPSKTNTSERKTPRGMATPKTSSSAFGLQSDSDVSACVIAVTEGRGLARGEVGIAAMDPRRPHLILCQISDTQRYVHSLAKMNLFNFIEAIVPNTFVEGGTQRKLYLDMLETFPSVSVNHVQRRHFSEAVGLQLIQQYCTKESESVMIVLRDKFYALSAAAALLKYIEFTQNVLIAPRSLKVEFQGIEGAMIIDLDTANRLELVMGIASGDPAHSLFGVLKHCRTKGGLRLLRANILQPYAEVEKIQSRLDCVSELINNPILFNAIEAVLAQMKNAENLLSLCMHPPQQSGLKAADFQLKYTILLKHTLEWIPSLVTALNDANCDYFQYVRQNLQDTRFQSILDRLLLTVAEGATGGKPNAVTQLQSFFLIRPGINGLLDLARKTYSEIAQEVANLVVQLKEKHKLPLRLGVSQNKGYHIQMGPLENIKEVELPSEFILVEKNKHSLTCYTTDLVALDQRCLQALNEIKLMTNVLLFELLTDIRDNIACLFPLCEYIAELDVCITLAHVGATQDYVRPEFGDVLKITEARHPILDITSKERIVANDILADKRNNFVILTGPNQSGKSIYIRQIALLQVMAQIGSYIPSKEAKFRVADRIFSRIGFDDSIEGNASSLMVEMQDMEFIRCHLTPTSLIIVDELCRGTSVEEGTCLALAICEDLLDTEAFVFFTTHFIFITKLETMYTNVRNYHFEAILGAEIHPTLRFTHKMLKGVTPEEQYGIRLAELMGFPESILNNAKRIAKILEAEKKPQRDVSDLSLRYAVANRLRQEMPVHNASWDRIALILHKYESLYNSLPPEDDFLKQLLNCNISYDNEISVVREQTSPNKVVHVSTPIQDGLHTISTPQSETVFEAAQVLMRLHNSVPTIDIENKVGTLPSEENRNSSVRREEVIIDSKDIQSSCKRKAKCPRVEKNVTKKVEQIHSLLSEMSSKLPTVADQSSYYEWKYSKKPKEFQTVAVVSRDALKSPAVIPNLELPTVAQISVDALINPEVPPDSDPPMDLDESRNNSEKVDVNKN